jgi:zinc protease
VVFDRLVYGFHPYGLPQNGTPESLASVTERDLQQFHQTYYVPNNAILAVVGDVTIEEAVQAAERALGDWPRKEIPAAARMSPPEPTRRLIVIDKPGAVQTAIRVGHVSLPRAHPDFLGLDVAVKILGGEGGNRIGGVLRTERSLTYSASAEIVGRQLSGDLMATTDTRSEATPEALRLIVEEIARVQRERVTERELEGAQAYLAGNFPLTIETPNDIAAQVLEATLFGLDLRDLETYRERINAVTVTDIQRVARLYLTPDRLSIVLVGDASTFVNRLAGVGFDSYEVVPIADLDLTAVDFRKGGRLAQP